MRKLLFLLLLLAIFTATPAVTTPVVCEEKPKESLSQQDYVKLSRQATLLMRKKQYEDALKLLLQILQSRDDDAGCWYNAACCAALLKDKKKALKYLEKAFENGYVNFAWVLEDPDLVSIRNSSKLKSLLRKKKKYYKLANEKRFKQTSEYYGQHFIVKLYPEDMIIFVSDVEEEKYVRLLDIIRRVNRNHHRYLFRNKPNVYNIVLCPSSKEEYNKHYPPINALGVFMPGRKMLFVDLNVGEGTLVHEYTHALHFADMEALGQSHPIWIIEGLATLYENSLFYGLSKLRPRNGFRLMTCYNLLGTPGYVPLETMMKYGHRQFMRRAGACYAQSRMVMYWLNSKNRVKKFYDHYTKNYRTDSSGIFSLEQITGMTLKELEVKWQSYVKARGKGIFDTKVSLGVKLTMAALNCLIFEVDEDSPADKAGIIPGDIIFSYNGKILKGSADLTKVLSREKPGDKAKVVILRDGEKITLTVQFPEEAMIPGTAYLGVSCKFIEGGEGMLVRFVAKDSPAMKAGLKQGDILLELDGQRMLTKDAFTSCMAVKCPGNYLKLLIIRNGKSKRKKVKLGKKPKIKSGINPGV